MLGLGYYKSSFWILTWLLISGLTIFLRIILRDVVYYFSKNIRDKKDKVIIYGAGNAGAQLLNSLRFNSSTSDFVDDNSSLWNRTLGGLPI